MHKNCESLKKNELIIGYWGKCLLFTMVFVCRSVYKGQFDVVTEWVPPKSYNVPVSIFTMGNGTSKDEKAAK